MEIFLAGVSRERSNQTGPLCCPVAPFCCHQADGWGTARGGIDQCWDGSVRAS